MEKLTHYSMVINGNLVATGSQDLINPATGKIFATVALGTPEDVDQAVIAAKAAQKIWGSFSYGERSGG